MTMEVFSAENPAYTFVESVEFLHAPYVVRAAGGGLFVLGVLIMAYNMWMTIRNARENVDIEAQAAIPAATAH